MVSSLQRPQLSWREVPCAWLPAEIRHDRAWVHGIAGSTVLGLHLVPMKLATASS